MLRTAELLSGAARPDLYRINAFRVAQLHAGATPRDLTRRLERIKMLAKLGGQSQEPTGPLPLQPARPKIRIASRQAPRGLSAARPRRRRDMRQARPQVVVTCNQRQQRGFRREALANEDFKRVVQTGGIADVIFQTAKPFTGLQRRTNPAFTRPHPAAVADDGVDFTVMGQETERLCQRPCGTRVRGEALVKDRKRSRKIPGQQVRIKERQLPGRKQSLVYHRTRG